MTIQAYASITMDFAMFVEKLSPNLTLFQPKNSSENYAPSIISNVKTAN
jgi:hypothetical protein